MPRSAVENVGADYVLPVAEIGALLGRLVLEPAPEAPVRTTHPESDKENFMDEMQLDGVNAEGRPGKPAGFSCPECDGVLWELQDKDLIRFRCRVGHAYSAETLLDAQKVGLEAALWSALNALEEKAVLARRLAERATARGHAITARQFENQFTDALQRAELIRQALGQVTEEAAPASHG
jgi:two-component system chemotaxis response regulator CheB